MSVSRASVRAMPERCAWVPSDDPDYVAYHDEEWGVPAHDDRRLFEMLTLEGAQAGLSWATILHKRSGYRTAFAGFDPGSGRAHSAVRRSSACSRSRHRSQPPEGRVHGHERARVLEPARCTVVRCVRVGARRRRAVSSIARRGSADVPPQSPESVDDESRNSSGEVSGSSARRSATRSCRRSAWSTTTNAGASALPSSAADARRQPGSEAPSGNEVSDSYTGAGRRRWLRYSTSRSTTNAGDSSCGISSGICAGGSHRATVR